MDTDPHVPPFAIDRGAARVLVIFGAAATAAIVAGGLVAAVTGPLELDRGAWVAAYLVLVGGVALLALAAGAVALGATPRLGGAAAWVALAAFTAGNALVMVGTLVSTPWLVLAGAVVLAAVFVWFAAVVPRDASHPALRLAYRGFLVFLAGSAIVGCLLALR